MSTRKDRIALVLRKKRNLNLVYYTIKFIEVNMVFSPSLRLGSNFLYWIGPQAQLVVTEPELIKEVLNNKDGNYPKIDLEGFAKKLLGDGLSSSKGEKWANMRKVANHAFHAESLRVRCNIRHYSILFYKT